MQVGACDSSFSSGRRGFLRLKDRWRYIVVSCQQALRSIKDQCIEAIGRGELGGGGG